METLSLWSHPQSSLTKITERSLDLLLQVWPKNSTLAALRVHQQCRISGPFRLDQKILFMPYPQSQERMLVGQLFTLRSLENEGLPQQTTESRAGPPRVSCNAPQSARGWGPALRSLRLLFCGAGSIMPTSQGP